MNVNETKGLCKNLSVILFVPTTMEKGVSYVFVIVDSVGST